MPSQSDNSSDLRFFGGAAFFAAADGARSLDDAPVAAYTTQRQIQQLLATVMSPKITLELSFL